MSSPDVRTVPYENDFSKVKVLRDPFWPKMGFKFEVSPEELNNWATQIFHASEFLELFDGDRK